MEKKRFPTQEGLNQYDKKYLASLFLHNYGPLRQRPQYAHKEVTKKKARDLLKEISNSVEVFALKFAQEQGLFSDILAEASGQVGISMLVY